MFHVINILLLPLFPNMFIKKTNLPETNVARAKKDGDLIPHQPTHPANANQTESKARGLSCMSTTIHHPRSSLTWRTSSGSLVRHEAPKCCNLESPTISSLDLHFCEIRLGLFQSCWNHSWLFFCQVKDFRMPLYKN